jgi:hypothetical protein
VRYTPPVSDLERWLAAQARALGLSAVNVRQADPATLREYCALILEELAARGLLERAPEVGCYAAARPGGN